MANNFDWRTDDDNDWEGARPHWGRKGGRRRWLLPVAIVLTLLVTGGAVYWQVQQRLSEAQAALSDDIRSSFNLIGQASSEGDVELFRNLLSGSDLQWAADQQELFRQGWLFDLRPYGLSAAPSSVGDIQVTLSPELNSAEVTALATYQTTGGSTQDTVQLRQTKVFRRGERWVWSPPREEFWAGTASSDERYLSISYPVRDEALALRLARDLDLLLAKLCTEINGLTCPQDLLVRLELSRDLGALLAIGEEFASQGLFGARLNRSTRAGGELAMVLPTPTLLGAPIDDAGYQTLLRAYSTRLAVAMANRFVDAECCGTEARYRAAARGMLSDLGLDPWLGQETTTGPGLEEVPAENQVALLCSDGFRREQKLFLLDLSQMTWQAQEMAPELLAIRAMPGGDGVLLLGQVSGEKNTRSQVWHFSTEGAEMLLDLSVSRDEAEQISWELLEAQKLLVVEVPDLYRGFSRFFTIDLVKCGHGECPNPPQSTASRPVWSPEGDQMMMQAYGLLWWRVGPSMVPIGNGSAPFWVDEQRYGYVRTFGQEQAVILVQGDQDRTEKMIVTTSQLRDALRVSLDIQDLQTRSGRLLIGRVIPISPAATGEEESQWLILAFEMGRDGSVIQARFFSFDLGSGEVRLITHAGRLLSYNLSPSGNRLALGGFVDETGRWSITVLGPSMAGPDLAGQGMTELTTTMLAPGGSAGATASHSWSQDESWLLILDQGLLTLHQPDSGITQMAMPPGASCAQAAWYGQSAVP